jgi:hypothetical protein
MTPDHLLQHLQQDAPDVLQRLDPVIDHIYRMRSKTCRSEW